MDRKRPNREVLDSMERENKFDRRLRNRSGGLPARSIFFSGIFNRKFKKSANFGVISARTSFQSKRSAIF